MIKNDPANNIKRKICLTRSQLTALCLMFFILGAAVMYAVMTMTINNSTSDCCMDALPENDKTLGAIGTYSDFVNKTTEYQAAHPIAGSSAVAAVPASDGGPATAESTLPTYGGKIGKMYLQTIINSLGDDKIIQYRFFEDPLTHKFSVYFLGGNHSPLCKAPNDALSPERVTVHTGESDDSFCPTTCGLESN
jgi:hypothetical protein